MYRLFVCIGEQHTLWKVGLAALICLLSSFTAFRLLGQARAAQGRSALLWLLAAAFSLGAGAWSTHFVAMLGYDPGVVLGFEVERTLLSLLVAVAAAFLSLFMVRQPTRPALVASAGVLLTSGIGAMHFLGMAGVQIPGTFTWDRSFVAASLLAGSALAVPALIVSAHAVTARPNLLAALLLALAICALHFTGMAAAEAVPDPSLPISGQTLTGATLALGIAGSMFAVLGFAGLALVNERLRSANEMLRQRDQVISERSFRLDAALGSMPHGLCMFDRTKRLVLCNARYAALYGLPDDLTRPGTSLEAIFAYRKAAGNAPLEMDDILANRISLPADGSPATFERPLEDGRTIRIRHNPMPGGGYVASHEDITDRVRAEAQIVHMAHHDALTALPNRLLFHKEMERALTRVRRGEKLAVLCLDLDRFKAVNDTLGHPVGDALLRAVAGRLKACLRETDTVARLGGDEFAIIQVAIAQPEHTIGLAQRLIDALSAPYDLDGHQVIVGTSVGIALSPDDSHDPDHLLKSADMALYRAKRDGRGVYRFFEPEMDARMQLRRALEVDLRRALANGEFVVHYQPLISLAENRVSGFEALLRWTHPERGPISPADFVPLAEEIGLIGQIGTWVLRQACADAASWPANVRLAVNLSPAQFRSRTLVLDVMAALGRSGLPAHRLELEITETVMLQETETTLATLHQLRALGVRISLDDFGTGYSSLSYLRRFPFDKIKIDQSFTRDLPDGQDAVAIIRAVVGLGASLGMSTTAEGVETEGQLARLRAEGCTEVQGWLFSPARPASEARGLIERLGEAVRAAA